MTPRPPPLYVGVEVWKGEKGRQVAQHRQRVSGVKPAPYMVKNDFFFIGLLLVSLAVAERDVAALQGLGRSGGV